ncbi:MAG: hypothetical protein AAGL24_11815 [Pseudomonadota bacterium]
MVAYNFQKRFAGDVESFRKRQTIRAKRKSRHARAGEAVQLYTGMRTRSCRKLIDPDPVCELSTSCAIREEGITLGNHAHVDLDEFARADGFADFDDMKAWFRDTHGLPFIGQLIRWRPGSQGSSA